MPSSPNLSTSSDGSLYRSDLKGFPTVREHYAWTYRKIKTGPQLLATLRAGEWAWPGGYPMYFITSDGCALSFKTVRAELKNVLWSIRTGCNDGWRVVACDINYEDNDLRDEHTGDKIESAYGEESDG